MDIKSTTKPLNQFVKAIPKSVRIEEVIVFGSRLHGNATKDSDIDVLIISDDFKRLSEDQRLDTLYKATENIEPEIQPWGFTSNELQKNGPLSTVGHARDKGFRIRPKAPEADFKLSARSYQGGID